jgi:hypothetical protein
MISMGNWKPKYATAEQVAVIEQFAAAADENLEALNALGADCVHEHNKALARNCLAAFGVGMLVAATESLIRYLVKRRKEKKTEESDQ